MSDMIWIVTWAGNIHIPRDSPKLEAYDGRCVQGPGSPYAPPNSLKYTPRRAGKIPKWEYVYWAETASEAERLHNAYSQTRIDALQSQIDNLRANWHHAPKDAK